MNVPDKVGILHIFGAVITNFKPAQTGTGPFFMECKASLFSLYWHTGLN